MSPPRIPTARWSPRKPAAEVLAFLDRPAFDPAAEAVAREVLETVRTGGDAALRDAIRRFDRAEVDRLAVSPEEIAEARRQVDADTRRALRTALERIRTFSRAGLRRGWRIPSERPGGFLGEQFVPYDRVGCYIPGGAAPLVSTALMTIGLAKVARVPEIVACTPAGPDGRVNPHVLTAMVMAGATEILKMGGIQAIGALAFGTESIRPVQKIVGPGGPYVTAAKRQVYGVVDLDLVAGPSEVAILADDSANPRHVALDLLAQLEHGTGHERALLVTDHRPLLAAVTRHLRAEAARLSRAEFLASAMTGGGLLLVSARTLDDGMDLVNRFAPEHFELMVRRPRRWLSKVRAAGAVFIGPWTPECAGDYVAGPSHVLPTGGAAARFSGLSVDSFQRRTSLVCLPRAELADLREAIETFGRIERLDAHARSCAARFEPS